MIIDLRKRKGTKEYNQLFMFRHIGSVIYIYIYIYIIYYIFIYICIYSVNGLHSREKDYLERTK